MKRTFVTVLGAAALFVFPLVGSAQKGDQKQKAPTDALVGFGVLPTGPLGTAAEGCLQAGGIRGPGGPWSEPVPHPPPGGTTLTTGGRGNLQGNRRGPPPGRH